MLRRLLFALDYAEEAVQTIIFLESLTPKLIASDEFIGKMVTYTFKDVGKDTYENAHGGSEWSDDKCKVWMEAQEDRTANVDTLGFKKRNFGLTAIRNRVKVDNMNLVPLVIGFTSRHRLDLFPASFLRRLSWMLMTGNYELSVMMVIARFAAGCDARRLEALAEICEIPAAARDLNLVKLVLCGFEPPGTSGARNAYAMRRVPRFVDSQIDKYDLFDIQALRDTGLAPVRFRLPAIIRTSWTEQREAGSVVIVDLDTTDTTVQRSLLKVMRKIDSNEMGLLPLFWEHGRDSSCEDGLLSTGYIEAALNLAHVRADGSCVFDNLSILDVFPYCTPLFAQKVEDARKRYADDEPLLAIEKELNLREFAASKNCTLHGIVKLEDAIELLADVRSTSSPTAAMVVHCADAHGKPHHFASSGRARGRPQSKSGSGTYDSACVCSPPR